MHFLVVADPLESFKIAKDSTFAMLREAQQRYPQAQFLWVNQQEKPEVAMQAARAWRSLLV